MKNLWKKAILFYLKLNLGFAGGTILISYLIRFMIRPDYATGDKIEKMLRLIVMILYGCFISVYMFASAIRSKYAEKEVSNLIKWAKEQGYVPPTSEKKEQEKVETGN